MCNLCTVFSTYFGGKDLISSEKYMNLFHAELSSMSVPFFLIQTVHPRFISSGGDAEGGPYLYDWIPVQDISYP